MDGYDDALSVRPLPVEPRSLPVVIDGPRALSRRRAWLQTLNVRFPAPVGLAVRLVAGRHAPLAAATAIAFIAMAFLPAPNDPAPSDDPAGVDSVGRGRPQALFTPGGQSPRTTRIPHRTAVLQPLKRRVVAMPALLKVDGRDIVKSVPFVDLELPLTSAFDEDTTDAPVSVPDDTDAILAVGNQGEAPAGIPLPTARPLTASRIVTAYRRENTRDTVPPRSAPAKRGNTVNEWRFGFALPRLNSVAEARSVPMRPANVSVFAPSQDAAGRDGLLAVEKGRGLAAALSGLGVAGDVSSIVSALKASFPASTGGAGTARMLWVDFDGTPTDRRIARASLYLAGRHVATVARDGHGDFVSAGEPARNRTSKAEERRAAVSTGALQPAGSIYDAVNRSARASGLSRSMTHQLVRLMASSVDLTAPVDASDRLEVFFSKPDARDRATHESKLFYVRYALNGAFRTLYRHEGFDGTIGFFGAEGRAAHQGLLEKPVAGAVFSSGFGMRPHPILGGTRMHSGVDWAAPAGTPIVAAADGIVERAGAHHGYGLQTLIRHDNGYETSYSHQQSVAGGIAAGTTVRQGQVIGFVGESGLATGPHVHFEVIANGRKIDPMNLALTETADLHGAALDAFLAERDQIDTVLYDPNDGMLTVTAGAQ